MPLDLPLSAQRQPRRAQEQARVLVTRVVFRNPEPRVFHGFPHLCPLTSTPNLENTPFSLSEQSTFQWARKPREVRRLLRGGEACSHSKESHQT